jgi:hypothetical protein
VRRVVVVVLAVTLASGCSSGVPAISTTSSVTAPSSTTSTTSSAVTTTTSQTTSSTVPASTSTTAAVNGAPAVDMVPAGYDIEDFVPLVENYFAVRNWALEHPSEATEDILATVIEPGSPEMDATMAEIQDLVDQGARYEGLSETFALRETHQATGSSDLGAFSASVGTTIQYSDTLLVTPSESESDTLRRAGWTLEFVEQRAGPWLVESTLRNPFVYKPGAP